tara:strand:- start:2907 stop:3587 length:681 start_codon:yes stop_codon:yes gene_type:complete
MSLQTILSICETVGINDQRFIGQTLSRNQKLITSEILTVVPFGFDLKPMNYLLYSKSRGILNSLRIPDKSLQQFLNFTDTGWSHYTAYQGDMSVSQLYGCNWKPASANKTLVLGDLPNVAVNKVIFRIGDFVQVGLYSYIVTVDVLRGSLTTVDVPVHRNLLSAVTSDIPLVTGQYGQTVSMGGNSYTGITFPVVLRDYPNYTLTPMTNDSYINWNGSFKAFESVL